MSKSKAVQWPVLVTNSVSKSTSTAQSVTWKRIPRHYSNTTRKAQLCKTRTIKGLPVELLPPGWRSSCSNALISSSASILSSSLPSTSIRQYTSRSFLDPISCICSFSHFSPFLSRFLLLRRTTSPRSSCTNSHQTRHVHSSNTSDVQDLANTASSGVSARNRTRTGRIPRTRAGDAHRGDAHPGKSTPQALSDPNTAPLDRKKKQLWVKIPPSPSATKCHDPDPDLDLALNNFRLLIHSDHPYAQHLRLGSQTFHEKLATEHQLPSSIIPPLSALQQLYSYLDSTALLNQLSTSDWNSFIFWLSHHKDYHTMSHLHEIMFGNLALSSQCSAMSYTLLTEARLELMCNSQSALSPPGHSEQMSTLSTLSPPSVIVENTIDLMVASNVSRSSELYGLWLQKSVQEKNWRNGIEAWMRMKADTERLLSPSIAMTAQVIQCYLHTNNMTEVATLFKSTLERSSSAQQRQNYAMVQDGGLLPESSSGHSDGEREIDGRLEFLKRLKQAFELLTTLQQKSVMNKKISRTNSGSPNPGYLQEWKEAINPALIEAICLDERDSYGASVASGLAMELCNHGYTLDRTRFRYLAHYIGACNTAAGAETFIKRLIEVAKSPSSVMDSSQSLKGDQGIRSTPHPAKETRRTKRIVELTSQGLLEVGLQEVVKQAITEKDFNHARRIFLGMVDERISLGADASEKLITGLTKVYDFRTALTVLDRSLQENRVPSIETVNKLFKGLIKHHMLDEAVALFRDLTENHGLKPDLKMYRNLMNLTSAHGQLGMTQRIVSTLRSLGIEPDGDIYRGMMLCYVRVENLRGAIKVFEAMDQIGIKNEITHINVLLEGAARYSSSNTVVGILEIMASQKIRPNAETWNILLSGAFRAKDRVVAREVYQELIHAVAEGSLRASRHPGTFQLLLNEYADRHGVDSALRLLKGALDARYPNGIASSMYRELIDKSCMQGKGVAGYEFYRLLRRSQHVGGHDSQDIENVGYKIGSGLDSSSIRLAAASSALAHAFTSTSPTVAVMSLPNLFWKLMTQLDQEGQMDVGTEMATDLILSGFEMNQELVGSSIRFYAKTGELAAAFGLFTKMGHAYNVEPTRDMVQDLYAAARTQGLSLTSVTSKGSSVPAVTTKWDEGLVQLWMRALKEAMDKVGLVADATTLY